MIRLTSLVLLTFHLALPALQEKKAPNNADLLQGTWIVTGITRRGKAWDGDKIAGAKMVIAGNKMTLVTPAQDDERRFTFKLDEGKKPEAIDLTAVDGRFKGQLIQGIYQLDGDSLKLCFPTNMNKVRPTEFSAPEGSPLQLMTLKKM